MVSATGPVSGAGNLGKPIRFAYIGQVWDVRPHPEVEAWFLDLCRVDPASADLVVRPSTCSPSTARHWGVHWCGPTQGQLVSSHEELRPESSGTTEIRMIFAFDPLREAVFLVAGDKSGQWQSWYRKAVPLADARFEEHLISNT